MRVRVASGHLLTYDATARTFASAHTQRARERVRLQQFMSLLQRSTSNVDHWHKFAKKQRIYLFVFESQPPHQLVT